MKIVITISNTRILLLAVLIFCSLNGYSQKELKFELISSLPRNSMFFGEGSSDQKIFILGGATSFNQFSKNLQVFDPKIKMWIRIPLKKLIPISFTSAIYIEEWDGLLFTGGLRERGAQLLLIDALTVINAQTYQMQTVGSLPSSAKNLGIARDSSYVYFFGGATTFQIKGYVDSKQTFSKKFYRYEISTGKVSTLPDMPVPMETTGGIIDGYLYTFGGYDGSAISDIYQFDIANKTWSRLGQLQKPLSASTVEIIDQHFILVGDYFDTDLLLIYDTKTQKEYPFRMNIKGRHKGSAILGDELHVFGGTQSGLLSNQHYKLPLHKIFDAMKLMQQN